MKCPLLFLMVAVLANVEFANAQTSVLRKPVKEVAPATDPLPQPPMPQHNVATDPAQKLPVANGSGLHVGSPDAIQIGGGEGVRIGTRDYGVQFGTGFGLQIGRIRSAGN